MHSFTYGTKAVLLCSVHEKDEREGFEWRFWQLYPQEAVRKV